MLPAQFGGTAAVLKKVAFAVATFVLAEPAFAHHVMGGRQAATFGEGLLSGLGHPVIAGGLASSRQPRYHQTVTLAPPLTST